MAKDKKNYQITATIIVEEVFEAHIKIPDIVGLAEFLDKTIEEIDKHIEVRNKPKHPDPLEKYYVVFCQTGTNTLLKHQIPHTDFDSYVEAVKWAMSVIDLYQNLDTNPDRISVSYKIKERNNND